MTCARRRKWIPCRRGPRATRRPHMWCLPTCVAGVCAWRARSNTLQRDGRVSAGSIKTGVGLRVRGHTHPCGPLPPLAHPSGTVSGPSGPTRNSTALKVTASRRASPSVCSRGTMAHVPWMSTCHDPRCTQRSVRGHEGTRSERAHADEVLPGETHERVRFLSHMAHAAPPRTWHGTPSTSRSAMFCTRPFSASMICVLPRLFTAPVLVVSVRPSGASESPSAELAPVRCSPTLAHSPQPILEHTGYTSHFPFRKRKRRRTASAGRVAALQQRRRGTRRACELRDSGAHGPLAASAVRRRCLVRRAREQKRPHARHQRARRRV